MNKIKTFLKEVKAELLRVSWPKGKELWGSTWVVIILSILLAIFIGIVDILLSRGMSRILR